MDDAHRSRGGEVEDLCFVALVPNESEYVLTPTTVYFVTAHMLQVLHCETSEDFGGRIRGITTRVAAGTPSPVPVWHNTPVSFFLSTVHIVNVVHSALSIPARLSCFAVQVNSFSPLQGPGCSVNVFKCVSIDTLSDDDCDSYGYASRLLAMRVRDLFHQHYIFGEILALVDLGVQTGLFPTRLIRSQQDTYVSVPLRCVTNKLAFGRGVRGFLRSKGAVIGKNVVYPNARHVSEDSTSSALEQRLLAIPYTARSILVPKFFFPYDRLEFLVDGRRRCHASLAQFLAAPPPASATLHDNLETCTLFLILHRRSSVVNVTQMVQFEHPLASASGSCAGDHLLHLPARLRCLRCLPCALSALLPAGQGSDATSSDISQIVSLCDGLRRYDDVAECEVGDVGAVRFRFSIVRGLYPDSFIAGMRVVKTRRQT